MYLTNTHQWEYHSLCYTSSYTFQVPHVIPPSSHLIHGSTVQCSTNKSTRCLDSFDIVCRAWRAVLQDAILAAPRAITQILNISRPSCGGVGLGLQEGEVALCLLVAHQDEADNNGNPVDVVGDYGAIGCTVLPAEDGVKDTPSTASVEFGVTVL